MNNNIPGIRLSFFLLAAILLIYALIMAKDFLYPLTFGILIAYLLLPVVNYLEKKGMPRIISILIPIIISLTLVVLLATFVFKKTTLFLDDLPQIKEKTIEQIEHLQVTIEDNLGVSGSRLKTFLVNRLFDIGNNTGELFTTTTGTLFAILMQPVYVFLFLYYRTKFAYFIMDLAGRQNRLMTIQILKEIATVVTRYMLGITTVVLILCFVNSVGLMIIGLKYAILLGVISAMFSYIPYFGTAIGGSISVLYAYFIEDSNVIAFRVLIFAFFVHFLENNVLGPNIVGHNIRLNPFIIIIGLIAGAMIWGLPGMLVTIPFLAMLNIIMKRVPAMQSYAFLLGTKGTRRHAITLRSFRKFLPKKNK